MKDRIEWQTIPAEVAPTWTNVNSEGDFVTVPYLENSLLSLEEKLDLAARMARGVLAAWQVGKDPLTGLIFGRAIEVESGQEIKKPEVMNEWFTCISVDGEYVYGDTEDLLQRYPGVSIADHLISFRTISQYSRLIPSIFIDGWEITSSHANGTMYAQMDYGKRQNPAKLMYNTQGYGLNSQLHVITYMTDTHIYDISITAKRLFEDSGIGEPSFDDRLEAGQGSLSFSKMRKANYKDPKDSPIKQTWVIDQDGIESLEYQGKRIQRIMIRGVEAAALASIEMYKESLQSGLQEVFGMELPDVTRMALDPEATFLALYRAIMTDPCDDLLKCIVFKDSGRELINLLTSAQISESFAKAAHQIPQPKLRWSWEKSRFNPKNW